MNADRWYELANQALKEHKYHEAKDMLQNVIKLNKKHIQAYHDLAIVYIHQGKFEEALIQYEKLSILDDSILTRTKHAGILLFLDRPKDAENMFKDILEMDSENNTALKGLADSYFRQYNFKMAQETYDYLLRKDPKDAFVWYSKAEAFYRAQAHDKAFEAIEEAIKIEQAPEFFAFKGDFFIRHENFERALEQYTLAANLNPKDTEIRLRLGFIFRILERRKDALDAFDKALEINPYSIEALENKIELLQEMGNQAAALGTMEQLVRLHPEDDKTGIELAEYYVDNGGYERAAEIYEILIKPHYDNPNIWYSLSYCLTKLEKYEKAKQAIIKAIEFGDDSKRFIELKEQITYNLENIE